MKPLQLLSPTALFLAALAGCATSTGLVSSSSASESSSPDAEAQRALMHNDYFHASHSFEQLASQTPPPQAYEYHLRAAEAATDGNDYGYAAVILDNLPQAALDPEQQLRLRLLRARAALARNDAAGALRVLPQNPNIGPGNSPLLERVLLLRGRALFRLNDPVDATQALVMRDRVLGNSAAAAASVQENRDAIWAGLSVAPLDAAALARASSADPITRGWIELANLSHRNASLEMYENWRQRYPGHPAQDRLGNLMMPSAPPASPLQQQPLQQPPLQPLPLPQSGQQQNTPLYVAPSADLAPNTPPGAAGPAFSAVPVHPGFYAMLLPQSGALASYAEAVHSGFAAAAARAGNGAEVRVYDASNPQAALAAYNQATADGAGMVIGPLLKGDVNALSQAGGSRLPVLALNYLDAGRPVPPGFYQFGLAPEDEARAAAEDAAARGLHHALALVADGDRGSRVLAAFEQRMRELGGDVRDSRRYSGSFQDYQTPIASLLHYRPVDDKKKLAEMRASAQPGTDPQRRNDFDLIFIDAGTSQARQLWPLFRYYHAERMPIYDTAGVNDGSGGDSDLAGIRFCDAPWMLDGSNTWAALRAQATNGRNGDLARFYVLGDDAFQLAARLSQNGLHPLDELPGGSGTLRVGDDGAVHRGLSCAQTTDGAPRLLDPPAATAPTP